MFIAYCVPKPRGIITCISLFVLLYSAGVIIRFLSGNKETLLLKAHTFVLPKDQIYVALPAFDRK